jgi:hypothetical protein
MTMARDEFTPGTWELVETAVGHEIRMGAARGDPESWQVQHVVVYDHELDPDIEEAEAPQYREACANARLLAAAPRLLAALRGLGGYVMSVKKTGNTAEWMEGLREKIDAADAAIREATGG